MAVALRNVVVVGGSYVGKGTAQKLANVIPPTHRVLLIEPHTHFHHIFTFPRFAVVPKHEHKAFIPYSTHFASAPDPSAHEIVRARVLSIQSNSLKLDREWQGSYEIPFDYLVVATGTTLTQPSAVKQEEKLPAVQYLRKHQDQIKLAKSILIAGGGAAGVQMATDLMEFYPDKEVVLVQSRDRLMPKFHPKLHEIIKKRFDELGVKFVTGARVIVPQGGFPSQCGAVEVQLTNGSSIRTEFVILATGQKPNNAIVDDLKPSEGSTIINPDNGMIRVRPSLQFADPKYSNIFAVGDIADTGAHKAARPGAVQADVVTANVLALIEGRSPDSKYTASPAGIHISLGMKYNIVFRNPNPEEGQVEPVVIERDDGREDMGVDGMWQRMGLAVKTPNEYNL